MFEVGDYPGLRRRISDNNLNSENDGNYIDSGAEVGSQGGDVNNNNNSANTSDTNHTHGDDTGTEVMDHQHHHYRNLQPLRHNRSRIRMDVTATIPSSLNFDNNDGTQQPQQQLPQPQQTEVQSPQQITGVLNSTNNNNNANGNLNAASPATNGTNTSTTNHRFRYKSSYMYILISSIIALLAIISPPSTRNIQSRASQIVIPNPTTSSMSSSSSSSSSSKKHYINENTAKSSSSAASTSSLNYQNTASTIPLTSKIATTTATVTVTPSFEKLRSRNNNNNLDEFVVDHAFGTVEQVARAAAAATLSDLGVSGGGISGNVKDKPRLLKYATTTTGASADSTPAAPVITTGPENVPSSNNANGKNGNSDNHHDDSNSSGFFSFFHNLWGKKNNHKNDENENISTSSKEVENNTDGNELPPILKWFIPKRNDDISSSNDQSKSENKSASKDKSIKGKNRKNESQSSSSTKPQKNIMTRIVNKIIDPSLLEWIQDSIRLDKDKDSAKTATYIVDKIIHSTPRILAIANLLLAGTYLLHSAVADLFLGEAAHATAVAVGGVSAAATAAGEFGFGGVGASASTVNRMHRSGRERLGGYLLFKLLLVSAVVEPDTLDLLILLSWYTLLSFLKSLSFLAGLTTAHSSAAGQMPHKGVFRLLIIILVCDITAAATCTALFHGAGWGIVILLTCDCALLAIDILTHLARFFQQVIDEKHQELIAELEARQIRLHEMDRNRTENMFNDVIGNEVEEEIDSSNEVRMRSRQLDHEMESLEATNSKRLELLDHTAFFLEIFALIITTGHFVHIWSLHGVTFNLVDGVLALHLHSAISAIGKKIAERRNHYRIARDLNKYFEDVSEIELKKACAAGDVCCICLGTMSMGNVKKIGCGHVFHNNCLREVVERARSIDAARCPLCRQSIVGGSHVPPPSPGMPQPFLFGGFAHQDRPATPISPRENQIPRVNNQDDNIQNRNAMGQEGENVFAANSPQNQRERALFRFSTEGVLPAWLPLPAFSFEVVRRPPLGTDNGGGNVVPTQMQPQQNMASNNTQERDQQNQQDGQPSFWRRLLILAGAIPMTPEEELAALTQLVDMFPQYERADLLRELRERGSAEAVVESVLSGLFTGVDRGGAFEVENNDNNQVLEEIIHEDEQGVLRE